MLPQLLSILSSLWMVQCSMSHQGLFISWHFILYNWLFSICTFSNLYISEKDCTNKDQNNEKKSAPLKTEMIEKENCWYKNASSLLNCEIGSHGVNTCHSLKKSWMHVNHIWHFCVGRFKPQIDIMLLVNTYVLMMRMAAGTGQGGRSFAKVWRAFAKKFGLGRKS